MGSLTALTALFVLGLCHTSRGVAPWLDHCRLISPCLKYTETDCDAHGNRQVCVTYENTNHCAKVPHDPIHGFCRKDDFLSFRPPGGPGNTIVTYPWHPNMDFCYTGIKGGSIMSYGLRDHLGSGPSSSHPKDLKISGNSYPVACSEYKSVCDSKSNQDIQLDFQVSKCDGEQKDCKCHGYRDVGSCSVTCGTGVQKQEQICTGSTCTGVHVTTRTVTCNTHACPGHDVDGGWSNWVRVGTCSEKCGGGLQKRMRECDDPQPKGNGRDCRGPSEDHIDCNTRKCRRQREDCRKKKSRKAKKACRKRNRAHKRG